MSGGLPILAEVGAPASSNGRAWGLRRSDLEALGAVLDAVGDRGVVLVTGEEELTPTLAVGLAGAAAAAGTATALVECDVERPRLAAGLGLAPTPGLHEYLRWEAEPAAVVQALTPAGPASPPAAGPLACVCAGRPSADPRTLLGLGSFHHMARKLRAAYGLVILLGPPLAAGRGAADGAVAGAPGGDPANGGLGAAAVVADGILLALAARPGRRAAKDARAALSRLDASPLGAVLVSAPG